MNPFRPVGVANYGHRVPLRTSAATSSQPLKMSAAVVDETSSVNTAERLLISPETLSYNEFMILIQKWIWLLMWWFGSDIIATYFAKYLINATLNYEIADQLDLTMCGQRSSINWRITMYIDLSLPYLFPSTWRRPCTNRFIIGCFIMLAFPITILQAASKNLLLLKFVRAKCVRRFEFW